MTFMKLKVILTGATGMVGEGVLLECLEHPKVEKILVVGRRPCGKQDKKLKEVLITNFFDLKPIQSKLKGYDTCFFCLGVSSVGLQEEEYAKLTYDLTLNFAKTALKQNPKMTFSYISGSGTDSSAQGKTMWARVKGKTENDLAKMKFKKVYNFRPGFMQPTPGAVNTIVYYKFISWAYPAFRRLFPNFVTTLKELGQAMINAVLSERTTGVIEVPEIVDLAKWDSNHVTVAKKKALRKRK